MPPGWCSTGASTTPRSPGNPDRKGGHHALGLAAGREPAAELGDTRTTTELLGLLDARRQGQLPPLLTAERDLARARLAARDGADTAGESFAAAIRGLRERGTPYHLAHALLDQAEHLTRAGDSAPAAQAVAEARDIAGRLRCQPLLNRISDLASTPARAARTL